MRPRLDFIPLALVAVLAGGCASNLAEMDAAAEVDGETPVVEEKPIDPAYLAGPPADVAMPAEATASTEPTENSEGPGDSGSFWRPDGRPVWWLAAPRFEAGRVILTVEAMGSDLGDARAKAIAAAREAVRRHAGPVPGGEKLEAVVVRKLEGDAPGRSRYVGYARVSAREPESFSP